MSCNMMDDKNCWAGKSFSFFQNRKCEFWMCHKGVPEEDFSCLFCYCPLYPVEKCGGNFTILPNGIKDCSNCTRPHNKKNYGTITREISRNMKQGKEQENRKKCVAVSIFATEEQEKLFSEIARKSMINNAKE